MNFQLYAKLIADSVAQCGYDRFMPSLCIPSSHIELQVLEIDPQPEGDKEAALDWASAFTEADRVLYCAYRNGNRQVEVVEVTGTEVTNKLCIEVRPAGR
jgi:hypothetical protein